jgi:hypothetical protein
LATHTLISFATTQGTNQPRVNSAERTIDKSFNDPYQITSFSYNRSGFRQDLKMHTPLSFEPSLSKVDRSQSDLSPRSNSNESHHKQRAKAYAKNSTALNLKLIAANAKRDVK